MILIDKHPIQVKAELPDEQWNRLSLEARRELETKIAIQYEVLKRKLAIVVGPAIQEFFASLKLGELN